MSLIDTLDGVGMLWAYGWAMLDPERKSFVNLYLTVVSAVIALAVGLIEVLGCIQTQLQPSGWFWDAMAAVNAHFEYVGYSIIAFFLLSVAVAALVFRCRFGGSKGTATPTVYRPYDRSGVSEAAPLLP